MVPFEFIRSNELISEPVNDLITGDQIMSKRLFAERCDNWRMTLRFSIIQPAGVALRLYFLFLGEMLIILSIYG